MVNGLPSDWFQSSHSESSASWPTTILEAGSTGFSFLSWNPCAETDVCTGLDQGFHPRRVVYISTGGYVTGSSFQRWFQIFAFLSWPSAVIVAHPRKLRHHAIFPFRRANAEGNGYSYMDNSKAVMQEGGVGLTLLVQELGTFGFLKWPEVAPAGMLPFPMQYLVSVLLLWRTPWTKATKERKPHNHNYLTFSSRFYSIIWWGKSRQNTTSHHVHRQSKERQMYPGCFAQLTSCFYAIWGPSLRNVTITAAWVSLHQFVVKA